MPLDPPMTPEGVDQVAKHRTAELSRMFAPHITACKNYKRLVCHITSIIGLHPPTSVAERVGRNLLADAYDSLDEAERTMLTGKSYIAYPLLRRAYESISLLALLMQEPAIADRWWSGAQIKNEDIRRRLAKVPMGESETSTRELYRFFSRFAHTGRHGVPDRLLGEPNQFTLGCFGVPSVVLLTEFLLRHLSMWFWLGASISFYFREAITAADPEFKSSYAACSSHALRIQEQLQGQLDRLYKEENDYFTFAPSPSNA